MFDSSQEEFKIVDLANTLMQEIERRKIAERKQNEYLIDLEKTNKELDQFAYVVSHDLKAPLRAIASLADWLEEDLNGKLSAESIKNLDLLKGRASRMENMIHGILAYSKAGKQRGELSEVNTEEMVQEIIDSLNPPPSIKISIENELPTIRTESMKLQQVLSNLISNSIKYMDKEKGLIKISCLQMEDYCQFSVEDNGPGIEKEYHEKVFMIFQTLSARDHVESTGIGLSIVKKIIDDRAGKIWIESKVGEGSKFNFTWKTQIINKQKQIA
jgi:light-regulated signal transduction histidine kinase (bacteriophytochrome)